jgi:hypothetical protein
MKPVLLIFVCFLFILHPIFSQEVIKADTIVNNGKQDSIAEMEVKPVVIFPPVKFESKREMVRYDRLVYNVKKVWPYAKLAGQKLKEYEKILDTIPDEKARKVFMKKAEKELEAKFGVQIRDLSFSQGKILIKLIYRETGNSSYELVKELRGGFRAFIWQTLAVIFGYNLKTTYDAGGDDQAIERIVIMIEAGAI